MSVAVLGRTGAVPEAGVTAAVGAPVPTGAAGVVGVTGVLWTGGVTGGAVGGTGTTGGFSTERAGTMTDARAPSSPMAVAPTTPSSASADLRTSEIVTERVVPSVRPKTTPSYDTPQTFTLGSEDSQESSTVLIPFTVERTDALRPSAGAVVTFAGGPPTCTFADMLDTSPLESVTRTCIIPSKAVGYAWENSGAVVLAS
jgi:hypothetical protein